MNANVEFDEIRPYHDEELPQVYEELIADAAFRQAVDTVMPGVPFEVWSQKMRACKTKLEFQKTFCYGLLWKLAKEATDGLTWTIPRCRQTSRRRIPISPIIATLFSIPVSCPFFW